MCSLFTPQVPVCCLPSYVTTPLPNGVIACHVDTTFQVQGRQGCYRGQHDKTSGAAVAETPRPALDVPAVTWIYGCRLTEWENGTRHPCEHYSPVSKLILLIICDSVL